MARKPKTPPRELPVIPQELVDPFVKVPMAAEAVQDAAMAFKKALIERALGAEMGHHLGYATGTERPPETTNQRNGRSAKTVLTDDGPLALQIPRDRDASFEPILIPKHERRFTGFDDKIIAMYTRGMTVRDIQAFLLEQYGAEVSQEFVSSVTDAVMDEVLAWQSRPLEPMYPVVFFDALRVKIRSGCKACNKRWVRCSRRRHYRLASVHLIRSSLDYANWKDRKALAAVLKPVHTGILLRFAWLDAIQCDALTGRPLCDRPA